MTLHPHTSQKVPTASQRRLSTINQRIALFRHLAQILISLARSLSEESLPKREERRLYAVSRLLSEELQRNRFRL
ncbi:MAG: hypothetical protein NT023_05320 [Armatimonadetes bacterium]|nr:hypothetical protein [Armatimonadota bacterium]